MEKWIGPIGISGIYDWLLMEESGDVSVNNKGTYTRGLDLSEKKQLLYWATRGVLLFKAMCWSTDRDTLKSELGTNGRPYIAMIGDVTEYRLLTDFIVGKYSFYSGEVITYSSLSDYQKILIKKAEMNISWVRPCKKEHFPMFPAMY